MKTRARKRKQDGRAASLRRLRAMLLQLREELAEQMNGQLDDARRDRFGGCLDDFADRASDSLYDDLAQGFAELASSDLKRIDRAIERMDDQTYGTCEHCGKNIPLARLRLLPFAELCVECQREVETKEVPAPQQRPRRPSRN